MKKKKLNYLDVVPYKNPKMEWHELDNGHIELYKVNRGLFYFISQKIFGKPRVTKIEFEEIGSFIWKHIDGKRTIWDISEGVHAEFGDKAEPLVERLVKYFKILASHRFIYYKK